MKKTISSILVLILLVTMSTTVFASSITDTETGNSQEVLASYAPGTEDTTIISVDIGWNKMSFTYNGASEPVWDATNHQYVGEAKEAYWAASEATITITNHSNSILQATISYKADDAYSDIDMIFTDKAPYIGSAHTEDQVDEEGNILGTPCTVTVKVIPDGALSDMTEDNTRIGVITVKVTSDHNGLDVLDAISTKLTEHPWGGTGLARGTVYVVSQEAAGEVAVLIDEVTAVYQKPDATAAERNVAVNALITAYYGGLEIVQ